MKKENKYGKINKVQRKQPIILFRDIQVSQIETDVLTKLKSNTLKEFVRVENVQYDTNVGFSIRDNEVTGIRLYTSGFGFEILCGLV